MSSEPDSDYYSSSAYYQSGNRGFQPNRSATLLQRRFITRYQSDDLPYYGAGVKGLSFMQIPFITYLFATVCAFVLYHLEQKYDLICGLWFHYRHPACQSFDPTRFEKAYRDKLHQDFEVYEPYASRPDMERKDLYSTALNP